MEQHLAIGQRLLNKGRYDEAVREFESVLSFVPNHPEAQLLLAKAQQAKATQDAEAARQRMRQAIEQHLLAGEQLLDEGDCVAAQERFRAILDFDPNHEGAKRLLVKAQRQEEEQRVKAEADRRRRIVEQYVHAGEAAMDRRDYQGALDQFAQALEADPKDRDTPVLIKKAQRAIEKARADAERAERIQAAQEIAAEAARVRMEEEARARALRDQIEARLHTGQQFMAQGRFEDAQGEFRAALQADEHHKGARQWLSKAEHALEVRQRELELARRTQEEEERRAKAEQERLAREAQEAEARRQHELQVKKSVEDAIAEGRRLLAQGQFDNAVGQFRAALKLDPKSAIAQDLIKTTQQRRQEQLAAVKEEEARRAQMVKAEAERKAQAAKLQRTIDEQLVKGKRALERGDFAGAQAALQQILKMGPHLEASRLMAQAEQAEHEQQTRKELLEKQRAVEKKVEEGRRLAQRGAWSDALDKFQQAIQIDPGHPEAKALLQQAQQAQLTQEAQRKTKTQQLAKEQQETVSRKPQAQSKDADAKAKQLQLAQEKEQEAARKEREARVHRMLAEHVKAGKLLLSQGKYDDAAQQFERALQLDAQNQDAAQGMAKADQARAAERDQQRAASAADEAKAQSARTQYERKAQETQERIARQAQDLSKRVAREKQQARVKQETDQQRTVSASLAKEQRVKALYDRGVSLYQSGDYEGAVGVFDQMAAVDPSHDLVQASLWLKDRAKMKLAEAQAKDRELAAKRAEIDRLMADARAAADDGKHDQALALLEQAIVKDPGNQRLQQLMDQTESDKVKVESRRLQAQVDKDEAAMATVNRQVERDEQRMVNEVLKAQVLPDTVVKRIDPTALARGGPDRQTMMEKLRQPVSLDFSGVALGDVLSFLAEAAGVSIIPSPQLDLKTRLVSLKAKDLPLELALKYLAKSQTLAFRIEPDAIVVATAEEFSSQPMDTRVFGLRSGLGPYALETSAVSGNPALELQPVKDLIEQTVPQPAGSKVVVDERSGAIIVTNTSENLELVDQLLLQLDVAPIQVLIEGRFIQLNINELDQLGLEAVLTGDVDLTKKKQTDGTLGPGHQIVSGGGFRFTDQDRQDEGANLTLEGVLTGTQFESVLHLLEESQKTKTLSAPRVTALNNRSATIRVVDEFRYPTRYQVSLIQFDINGDGDFDDAGETEFANVPQDFKERDVGILLHVTPSVGKDMKTITLVLAPEVSQFSEFRDLGGGVTVPEFTTSQLTTSVIMENGQTVVLGGLMKDVTTDQTDKVPFFGSIPVVGKLFQQHGKTSQRQNLLIFITARILAPKTET